MQKTLDGYVLVGVLLLLLAVTGVGHTLLVMTRSEFSVSLARWDQLAKRLAAEAGRDMASRDSRRIDALPRGEWVSMGSATIPPRARYEARGVRLSREVLLIRSEGSLDTRPGRDRQIGLYWAMDPVTRLAAARGIIESGGGLQVETDSEVEPGMIRDAPARWPGSFCDRFRADLDTLFTSALSPRGELYEDPRAETRGDAVSAATEPALPALGLLGHDALMTSADVEVSGMVTPAPIDRLGRCDTSKSTNWGAPLDDAHPCVIHRPLVKSERSLIVDGGEGQGILMISGDAVFQSAARYYGLVVVAGDLEVMQGSEIHGFVRVRGAVSLSGSARIVGSACPVLLALETAEQLRELAPIPESAWPEQR